MNSISDQAIDESMNKKKLVFMILLGSCWDLFYPYLMNENIGQIDSALTEKCLRKLYLNQVSKFYLTNSILLEDELKWIIKRGISLTVCRLNFQYSAREDEYGEYFIYISPTLLANLYFILLISLMYIFLQGMIMKSYIQVYSSPIPT